MPVLPGQKLPKRDALPVVLRVTENARQAYETAERLRAAEAGVVVLEEWSDKRLVCPEHPTDLFRSSCRSCHRDICAGCLLEAEGEHLCRGCRLEARSQTQRVHTRQLFVVFLFCVFLYEVYAAWSRDTELRTSFDAIPVALLQFVPSGQQLHPTVRGLSGLDTTGWDGPTYADIARFFDEERLRYTGHAGSALQLSVRGPWAETPQPPELQPDAGLARATLAAMLYQRYWRRLGSLRGVDKKAFPLRLFVIFTAEEGDQAAESRAALGGHVAVTYISLDDPNPVYPAITLAHELAHLLGATDKYDEQGFSVYPEGYVEPYDEPIYPQRYAELMSVDIPISLDLEREPQGLHQLRLGYRSAAEMGWIAADVADAFYRAPDLTPDQLLERGEAEEEAPDPEPAPPLSADLEAGEAAVDQGG